MGAPRMLLLQMGTRTGTLSLPLSLSFLPCTGAIAAEGKCRCTFCSDAVSWNPTLQGHACPQHSFGVHGMAAIQFAIFRICTCTDECRPPCSKGCLLREAQAR